MKFKNLILVLCFIALTACSPLPVENIYRKNNYYPKPENLNVPVAWLTREWAGNAEVLASGWIINRVKGLFMSAKHFTDVFMNRTIELGGGECKIFLNGKVYTCFVVQVQPVRDAVLIKISSSFNPADLPPSYKISKSRPKIGDKIYVQGFHPHSLKIMEENEKEGFKDFAIPILSSFYQLRTADPLQKREVVFDNLEGTVVKSNPDSVRSNPFLDHAEKAVLLKYENGDYIKILTARDHKFPFGGLSGGVVINSQGEAFGVITAQDPLKFEYDKKGFFIDPGGNKLEVVDRKKQLFDTIYITPIDSIRDLFKYADQAR